MNLCRICAVFVGLWVAGAGVTNAQIFLRLDGASGSTSDTNHAGWLDISSESGPAVSNSGMSNNTASFQDFCLIKCVDSNSPSLLLQCAAATAIPTGTIDFVSSAYSTARFFRVNLTNIYISSISHDASGSSPNEIICFSAQSYSWNYTKFATSNGLPAAYLSGNWDIPNKTGVYSTTNLVSMSTGIRAAGGTVILQWVSTAGRDYRIYAVSSLTKPFQLVTQLTAVSTGNTNYTYNISGPARFYVVEEVPAGY
jgi:type VI secretion system secreted protein Hcp